MAKPPPLLFSTADVAALLGISAAKVRLMVRDKDLGAVRIGTKIMIPRVEVERLISRLYLATVGDDQAAADVVAMLADYRTAS